MRGGFETLTLTEQLAMRLLAAGLNTHEMGLAMRWTFAEAQTLRNKLQAMCSSASRSAALTKRATSSRT